MATSETTKRTTKKQKPKKEKPKDTAKRDLSGTEIEKVFEALRLSDHEPDTSWSMNAESTPRLYFPLSASTPSSPIVSD